MCIHVYFMCVCVKPCMNKQLQQVRSGNFCRPNKKTIIVILPRAQVSFCLHSFHNRPSIRAGPNIALFQKLPSSELHSSYNQLVFMFAFCLYNSIEFKRYNNTLGPFYIFLILYAAVGDCTHVQLVALTLNMWYTVMLHHWLP